MSKMRIKKHKGVKLLETRHPPPKKNSDDEDEEEKLLQCIMCNCMTIEEYLKRHIRYNHLISKEDIIDKLYNLHYPTQSATVSTQTSVTWIDDLEHRGNPKDDPDKGKKIRPKHRPQRQVESDDNDHYNDGPTSHQRGGDDEEEVLCPACGDVEDGTPMIACDQCDRWYHWACVGLNCKPPKGQEWMCTECSSKKPKRKMETPNRFLGNRDGPGPSGLKAKFKRNLPDDEDDIKVTAVVKPKRAHDDEPSTRDRVTQRRLSGRGKSSPGESSRRVHTSSPDHSRWDNGSPHEQSKKRHQDHRRDHRDRDHSPRKKDMYDSPPKKSKKVRHESDSEDNDDDHDQTPEDLRYSDDSTVDKDFEPHESDYDEQEMKLGEKIKERKESQQKFKKKKKKLTRDVDEFDEMSRDDMRTLCHKELINASGNRDDLEQRLRRHFRKKKETQIVKKDKKKYKLTEVTEGDGVCKICGLGWNLSDDLELGPLYKYGVCQAHLHCLMFSSGLIQGGDEKEGIVGFMPDDVLREWQRGAKLKCTFCKEIYATVGCCQRTCMKTYHLPCGIKYGALNEYYGNFDSYCPLHRSKRTPKPRAKNYVLTDLGLVPEHVDMEAGFDSEKYRLMLKKLESETSERRKSTEKKEALKPTREDESGEPPLKKEKKDIKGSKKKLESSDEENHRRDRLSPPKNRDRQEESSDDEGSEVQKKRPGPKSKTMIKKKKVVEEFETNPPHESSEEDRPLSKIKKVKPTSIKKLKIAEIKTPKSKPIIRTSQSEPNPVSQEATGKREGKRVRKSTFGSDIYKSAQDELKRLLEKKHMINIDETFMDLAGTRRQRNARITSNADEDNDEDEKYGGSTKRSQSRSGRKCAKRAVVEVDDEEDFGSKSFGSKIAYTRKSESRGLHDDDEDYQEEEEEEEEEEEKKGKKAETIQSIADFLGDSKSKRKSTEKRKKRHSGPDSTDELIESEAENQKEESPDAFNEENSKSPIITPNLSENEFEDTEQDSGHENLDQNDGFTDCADLSNVTSDEGTDAEMKNKANKDKSDKKVMFKDEGTDAGIKNKSNEDKSELKVMFNDEENDEQMDLSGLIQNLEKDEEKKPIDTAPISRFKCPFCKHHSKSKKRIEQHISYSHNRKNLSKNLANKQEMMIFIGKNEIPDGEKDVAISESSQVGFTENYVQMMTDNFPFFKYSSDDMADAVEDKADTVISNQDGDQEVLVETEPSETKRVRKKTNKGEDFVHWDEVGKKSEKRKEIQSEKDKKDEKLSQDQKEVVPDVQASGPRKRGRQPKQEKEPESSGIKKQDEAHTRATPRRLSPRKEANDNKTESSKSDSKQNVTVPELKSSLRVRINKSVETKSEEVGTSEATAEAVGGSQGRRGRPKKEVAFEEPPTTDLKIEENSQSESEQTPQKRRAGRPKKEHVDKIKNEDEIDIKKKPKSNLQETKDEFKPSENTPTRRSGRANREKGKAEEDVKSSPETTTVNKRTRQTNKQEIQVTEEKKIKGPTRPKTNKSEETKLEEKECKSIKKSPNKKEKVVEEEQLIVSQSEANRSPLKTEKVTGDKQPDATQSDADSPSKDTYSEEGKSEKFSAIDVWRSDESPDDVKDESTPSKKGSRKGGRTPVKITIQTTKTESESEPAEENSKGNPDTKDEKKSSPFKLLFSTIDYSNDTDESNIKLNKVEQASDKEPSEVIETPVSSLLEDKLDSVPEKVEPDSTTNMEDVFDSLVRKTERSPESGKKIPESKEESNLVMKYTDEKGSEVTWIQEDIDVNEMPELYIDGKQIRRVDLKEIEHALDQDVQIPEKFREMLPASEDKDEENRRIVLRIKKVKS